MKRKGFIQYLILFILLVVFPAMSWLYLRRGLNYRQNMLEKLSPVTEHLVRDSTFNSRICILSFSRNMPTGSGRLQSVKDLFTDQGSVFFQDRNWSDLSDEFDEAWAECFKEKPEDTSGRIFLINQQGYIVNCYRESDEQDLASLPKHIAFLLPPEKRKTFQFKRERER